MARKIFIATGDVGPNRENPDEMFDQVRDVLHSADLVFGQLEPCIAASGSPACQPRLPMRCRPEMAAAIQRAGYDIISFATNHCLDWGYPALFDTIRFVNEHGMSCIGAGANLEEAAEAGAFGIAVGGAGEYVGAVCDFLVKIIDFFSGD